VVFQADCDEIELQKISYDVIYFFLLLTRNDKEAQLKIRALLSLEEASGIDDPWFMQILGAHQHTLQYLR